MQKGSLALRSFYRSMRGGQIASDLTAKGAPEAAVDRVVVRWGGIDILVNNAGYGVIEPFLDATYGLDANAGAQRHGPRHGARRLSTCATSAPAARQHHLPGSRMALPDYTAYTASKAGVDPSPVQPPWLRHTAFW